MATGGETPHTAAPRSGPDGGRHHLSMGRVLLAALLSTLTVVGLEAWWIVSAAPSQAAGSGALAFLAQASAPIMVLLALCYLVVNHLLRREPALAWHVAGFATAGAGAALLLGAALAPFVWSAFSGPPVLTVQLRLVLYATVSAAVLRLLLGLRRRRRPPQVRTRAA